MKLKVPPLRERGSDILMLAQHFVDRKEKDSGRELVLSDNVLRLFTEFPWPGNVRQLENAVDCACTMSTGPTLQISDLPSPLVEFELEARRNIIEQRQQISADAAAHVRPPEQATGLNDTSLTPDRDRDPYWSARRLDRGTGEAGDPQHHPAAERRQADGGQAVADR